MAKIYETEEDKKRDDIARHRDVGAAISNASASTLLFSGFAAIFSFLGNRFIPENAKNLFGGSMRKGMENTGWFALGMAVVSGASAFAGTMIKKRTQAEFDKLGPEQIKLPPDLPLTDNAVPAPSPYSHVQKLEQQAAEAQPASSLAK